MKQLGAKVRWLSLVVECMVQVLGCLRWRGCRLPRPPRSILEKPVVL